MAYKELIKQFWHEMYIELLTNPNDHRTDIEFCEEVKIHINTLSYWKRTYRKEIYDEVQRRRAQYFNELRAKAYKALAKKMEKDTNAIKLAFQLTGDLVERSESRIEHMTHKDKLERLNSLLKEANERQEAWKKVKEAKSGVEGNQGDTGVVNEPLGDEPRKDTPESGAVQPSVDDGQ